MAVHEEEEVQLLPYDGSDKHRPSVESTNSASTTSLVFDRIEERVREGNSRTNGHVKSDLTSRQNSLLYSDNTNNGRLPDSTSDENNDEADLETGPFIHGAKPPDKQFRRLLWILGAAFTCAWALGFFIFIGRHASRQASEFSAEPASPGFKGNGKKVTLDEVLSGQWRAQRHEISWIEGTNGEDGLLLERQAPGKDYLVVEDIRGRNTSEVVVLETTTLMKEDYFDVDHVRLTPSKVWPSRDMKTILIATDIESNWRHSFYARYWIFDVATQTGQPLDPRDDSARIQLASWSPQSDAIVFTKDNNMYLRYLSSSTVVEITKDGGPELFYGVPDWVYEEEVFSGNTATWWAEDGKYIAFLRTDESAVPEYPIEYFLSRPSGKYPPEGQENYPDVREIKYPKAGTPNPNVTLQFFDVEKGEVFGIKTSDEFEDKNRLITEIVWAGSTGKVLVRETNRESDILRIVLLDVLGRTGKTVRTVNVAELDGGWFEVSQNTRYIPADPSKGRAYDGYIDTIIHENYDHLGYFTPLDNPDPILLTSGNWEVVNAPSAVDLKNNLVYFVSTKESPIQRHLYSVKLDGTGLEPLTDTSQEGYYTASFSSGAKYALLSYDGPNIPWQKVISTRSNDDYYESVLETNEKLAGMAKNHELPTKIYSTVTIDGFELQVVERLPPHFNEKNKHPVLFFLYGGPGSQTVNKAFTVDFQSYVASSLGYIVVTVDGRGTGFIGREARCIIRGNIGYWESRDQIETAKIWAKKKYVDPSRLAIWGWSYGGYMTLKTLEQDAGQTFSYGMAVAPVTDWQFYDSIYTERYMRTPQHNYLGYVNASISNMTALHQNVRFLLMHGIADDNVHLQNSLMLLDALDMAGVENYDVHVFPDSDHGIYFHNANRIVYDKLSNWLINAFNGEWLKTANAKPLDIDSDLDSR